MPIVNEKPHGKRGSVNFRKVARNKKKKVIDTVNSDFDSEDEDEDDSSDYSSKSLVSERNITKARGHSNAVYMME